LAPVTWPFEDDSRSTENGTLRPIVGKKFLLADAARAHKEILEPGAAGKIVLTC
jgi:NADPH:quinone reductase-like Zn-dependent oxidoreductase